MAKRCDPGNIQSCSQFQDSTMRQILPWCKLFKLVFDQKILTAFHLTRILLSLKENQGRMAYKSVKPLRVKTTQKQTNKSLDKPEAEENFPNPIKKQLRESSVITKLPQNSRNKDVYSCLFYSTQAPGGKSLSAERKKVKLFACIWHDLFF